ncbi:276_t:CDS:2, partial [Acaulospora colombiana]
MEEHEAQKKVNYEVRDQLPKEVSKNALRKRTERARKIYDLFFRIGGDKVQRMTYIQQIKTFTAPSISNLSSENIKYVALQGLWEWENGSVLVTEIPSKFHEICVGTITVELGIALQALRKSPAGFLFYGATTTTSGRSGKEADVSIRPKGKPQVPRGGSDGRNEPWPSLVIEVAYAVTEAELKKKIETYRLAPNRAHDAIGINFNYIPGMCPTEMT